MKRFFVKKLSTPEEQKTKEAYDKVLVILGDLPIKDAVFVLEVIKAEILR